MTADPFFLSDEDPEFEQRISAFLNTPMAAGTRRAIDHTLGSEQRARASCDAMLATISNRVRLGHPMPGGR